MANIDDMGSNSFIIKTQQRFLNFLNQELKFGKLEYITISERRRLLLRRLYFHADPFHSYGNQILNK